MNRRQVNEAYRRISLSSQEKAEVLDNILSVSSGVHPDGKEISMNRCKLKPVVIVAMIALMVLLMGCAWAVLNLDDLIIGQYSTQRTYTDEESGEMIAEPEIVRDVISLQGIAGTPNQLAAKEWYDFENEYIQKYYDRIDNLFQKPDDYQAYGVGNQEMVDKVDEICERYGLKPAGRIAYVEPWQVDIFYDTLKLDSVVTEGAKDVDDRGGYFYECGNFKHVMNFSLNSAESHWQHPILVSVLYHDKDYLDTIMWTVDPEDTEQWNYTCADGTTVLIVRTGDRGAVLCDREDAFLYVGFGTVYIGDNGVEDIMTKRDMELIAEAIDFSVKPEKPDMDSAVKRLDEATESYEATKPERQKMGYGEFVQWQIAWRNDEFDNPPTLYYYLMDFNEDGVTDLMFGYEENITFIWTLSEDGEVTPLDMFDWDEANALWLTLDITPVEEFPFDEY